MKKTVLYGLLLSLILTACSNDSDLDSKKTCKVTAGESFYEVPYGTEAIKFDSSYNGKNCYLIYSNEQYSNVTISNNQINFCEDEVDYNASRSAAIDSEFSINKNAVYMGNGFWRDEVHFNYTKPDFENSLRSVQSSKKTYRDNSDEFFVIMKKAGLSESDEKYFEKKSFTLKSSGKYCKVWYVNDDTTIVDKEVLQGYFESLANKIDSFILQEKDIFGNNSFSCTGLITADNSTTLEVLIYDLFGDASEDQTGGVFGFFRPNDFIINNSTITNSNECQVIHIDSYFLQKNKNKVISTFVHEYQHLLNFCNKNLNKSNTWFSEMLSMCAEDVFQEMLEISDSNSPKSRIDFDFGAPWKGFLNWTELSSDDIYYKYANAYVFGAYLMRNYGGINLIHEIATNSYIDEEAVTKALKKLGYDEDFFSVLRKFGQICVFVEKGNVSLNKEVSQSFNGYNYNLSSIYLYDNYIFAISDNLSDFDIFFNKKIYTNDEKTIFVKEEPIIFNKYYKFNLEIQPSGFVVYYLGKINAKKVYECNNSNSKVSMTLVFKDD